MEMKEVDRIITLHCLDIEDVVLAIVGLGLEERGESVGALLALSSGIHGVRAEFIRVLLKEKVRSISQDIRLRE